MVTHLVRAVSFMNDVVVIEYTTPTTDLRSNGLMLQHLLSIPASEEYAERLDGLVLAVQDLLAVALIDAATYPAAADVDEDEASPYDNPLERDLPPIGD